MNSRSIVPNVLHMTDDENLLSKNKKRERKPIIEGEDDCPTSMQLTENAQLTNYSVNGVDG